MPKNPYAQELGRLGGLKGGPARSLKLTRAERQAIWAKALATQARKREEKRRQAALEVAGATIPPTADTTRSPETPGDAEAR